MTPATVTILKALTAHFLALPEVGEVVLGGFQRTPAGTELVDRLAPGKLLIIVTVDPIAWKRPTQATSAHGRWSEEPPIGIGTLRRLGEGADVYGTRFADGAWLASTVADFCDRLTDPPSAESRALAAVGIGVEEATLTQLDYAPGDGADLDAGFISVAAVVEIHAEVAATSGGS